MANEGCPIEAMMKFPYGISDFKKIIDIVIGFRFILAQLLHIGKKLDIRRKTIIISL